MFVIVLFIVPSKLVVPSLSFLRVDMATSGDAAYAMVLRCDDEQCKLWLEVSLMVGRTLEKCRGASRSVFESRRLRFIWCIQMDRQTHCSMHGYASSRMVPCSSVVERKSREFDPPQGHRVCRLYRTAILVNRFNPCCMRFKCL